LLDDAYTTSESLSSSTSESASDELDELDELDEPTLDEPTLNEIDELDEPTLDADAADITKLVQTVERGLQASVFQVEPVTHITYQLLFVDSERNVERIERHVMQLQQANVIDKFDLARVIKRARGTHYRLTALIVYNVDLTLKDVIHGDNKDVIHGDSDNKHVIHATPLLSLSNFKLRPTLACFHSVNSVHVVLSRNPNPSPNPPTSPNPDQKRHISIHKSALTRSRKRH